MRLLLRRVGAAPDAATIARQAADGASISRLPGDAGDLISIQLTPDGPLHALPRDGESLLSWLKGKFPMLRMAELGEIASALAPVVAALRDEAARLSKTGKRATLLLATSWPGRNQSERVTNMLRLTRPGFARLPLEEQLTLAAETIQQHRGRIV
jgi:hypothetical protein